MNINNIRNIQNNILKRRGIYNMITQFKDEIIHALTENIFYGLVIVNEEGFITHLNENYCRFLQVQQAEAVGKHVTNIIENTRMHHVIQTGEAELFRPQYIRNNYMIANRIPLISNEKIVGAIGVVLFRDMHDLSNLNSQIRHLLAQLQWYKNELQQQTGIKYFIHDIIGSSNQIVTIKENVKKIAPSDLTVLITGESGTGKELIAHSIHQLSDRSKQPFISVNCAAIPEHLFDSELFGYAEGAFTGAKKGGKKGKFQLANGGTLFLDEIGDMPLETQVKLLRVLQEEEIQKLGGSAPYKTDVRIIAATNKALHTLVEEEAFREDLYYRINIMNIHLPPLRERPEDIMIIAHYLLDTLSKKAGKRVTSFSDEVEQLFLSHDWPGNVRELENIIQSAIFLANSEVIDRESIPKIFQPKPKTTKKETNLKTILKQTEKETIELVLRETSDKRLAAKNLGISLSTLYEKIKEHSL